MSTSDADSFIERVLDDQEFAERLNSVRDDEAAVQAIMREAGFVATADEVRTSFLERASEFLDEEQLALIAGGLTDDQANGIMVGSIFGGMAIAMGASAAAAAA